jgi:hypothetical protein
LLEFTIRAKRLGVPRQAERDTAFVSRTMPGPC